MFLLSLIVCIAISFGFSEQQFQCKDSQPFCFWVGANKTDWVTAYADCTLSGGSLVSYEHIAYIEEWMDSANFNYTDKRVWSSLHRVNHRFQWLHHNPEFKPVAPSEWVPGHPLNSKEGNCVIANYRMMYESVDCEHLFAFICVTSTNRIKEPDTHALPSNSLQVKLKTFPPTQDLNYIEIERHNQSLMLLCDVKYNGSRNLEYSWMKDGIYLGYNIPNLTISFVNDSSKNSGETVYQQQGGYQCQAKESRSLRTATSNSITVSIHKVFSGIVSLLRFNDSTAVDIAELMERIKNSIDKVIEDYFKLKDIQTAWSHLYMLPVEDGLLYLNSLYFDTQHMKGYPESFMHHVLDKISEQVVNDPTLHSLPTIRHVNFTWATYCPRQNETINVSSDNLLVSWPSSWPSSIVHPLTKSILCIRDNNQAQRLSRSCLPNFIQGASWSTKDITKECKRVVPKYESLCEHGYQQLGDNLELCFKITPTGSWYETMAVCRNSFPIRSVGHISFESHKMVIDSLKVQLNESWLPVRRPSVYGPLLYYQSVGHATMHMKEWNSTKTWSGVWDEECLTLTKNGSINPTHCSGKALSSVCVYRPQHSNTTLTNNLCSPPWYGMKIEEGRLVCFQIVQNKSPMDWHTANKQCQNQHFEIANAYLSMVTIENAGKFQQWNAVLPHIDTLRMKSAWIGLRWSERNQKFCWFDSESDCPFHYFNWRSPSNLVDGYYGTMDDFGTWDLLSNSSLLEHVVCQAVVDLAVNQNMLLRPQGNDDSMRLELIQTAYHVNSTPAKSFNDLSEFFTFGWRPWTSKIPTAAEVGLDINCYLDGIKLEQKFNQLPTDITLHEKKFKSSNLTPKYLSCEGWIGWPRRFARTEPIIVFRPPCSVIYLLTLDIEEKISFANVSALSFEQDLLFDINRRLKNELRDDWVSINITSYRLWTTAKQGRFRIMLRTLITQKPCLHPFRDWTEILKNGILSPVEEQQTTESKRFSYEVVYVRSADACNRLSMANLFPSTLSENFLNPCLLNGDDSSLQICSGNVNIDLFWMDFTNGGKNIRDCLPSTSLLTSLWNVTTEIIANTIDSFSTLETLANIGTQWTNETLSNSGVETVLAAHILRTSVNRIQEPTAEEFSYASQIITMMLDSPSQLRQAQNFPGVANSLVESLEQIMAHVAMPTENASIMFNHPRMAVESLLGDEKVVGFGANIAKNNLTVYDGARILRNGTDIHLVEEIVNRDIAIVLPIDEIRERKKLENSHSLRLSFSILGNADLLDARPFIYLPTKETAYVVDSAVVLAQVDNQSISNLNEAVRIFFRSRTVHKDTVIPICVFWDKFSSSVGGWSTFGCRYVGRSHDLYICECNHLTPLALLFPYFDEDHSLDYGNRTALSLISMIGCVASMIGLSLIILTFLLFKKWRKTLGNKILFNFSLALFGVMCCFLCAGIVTDHPLQCKVTAATMHFFLLASFSWMVVEAIYQHLNYIVVIGAQSYKSLFMRKAVPLAWGIPLLSVVGISLYNSDLYLTKNDFCWMELTTFYVGVLAPMCLALSFNLIIFVSFVKNVLCFQKKSIIRTTQSAQTRSWHQFCTTLCIFFLLGLAWLFGFFSLGDARLVFAYLFCIFNSLQGFAMFVFFIYREKNARKLWFNFSRQWANDNHRSQRPLTHSSHVSYYTAKTTSNF